MFSELYGNEMLKSDLTVALGARRLAHAYLIEGPQGSGKHTLARALAKALAQTQGDGALVDKIERGFCPDVMVYGRQEDRKTISVELVRRVKESVYLQPVELSCKVYILEQTDLMTPQAQNALLKLLEEPPAQVYFFLLCESATSLLPTVRSRAPALRMEIFSLASLAQGLCEREPSARTLSQKDPEAFARILRESEGVYGVAKELLTRRQSKKELSAEERLARMLTLFAKRDTLSVCTATALLSAKREEMVAELSRLGQAISQILSYQKGWRQDCPYYEVAEQAVPTPSWMRLYDATQRCLLALQSNANLTVQQMSFTYAAMHALQGTPAFSMQANR